MINIVTALACEANPIIQHYGLRKSPDSRAFPLYENDTIKLIISGIGKYACASSVGYLQALTQAGLPDKLTIASPHIWLNVGIAGHKTLDIGTPIMAHRISDVSARQSYYPCFTFDLPCVTADVITVDHAETRYAGDAAYDMESMGFCAATSRFSTFELIHCVKIISDNRTTSHAQINKYLGEELVGHQLAVIDNLLGELKKVQAITDQMYAMPEDYGLLTDVFRFSVTQQNQLKRLLLRWRVLKSARFSEQVDISRFAGAKQVLTELESQLRSAEYVC